MEALSPRLHNMLPQNGNWLAGQATTVTVVILVAMEENRMTSLPVTENIRLSVLEDVVLYMERESNLENKRVLLQCFGVGTREGVLRVGPLSLSTSVTC